MNTKEDVLAIMQKENKPLRSSEISILSGVEKKAMDKIIKELKEEGKINSPKKCFWQAK